MYIAKLTYRQYLETYCQSVALVWKLNSNRRVVRVARYIIKGAFRPVASVKWAFALKNVPELHLWLSNNPRLLLKPGRHYISRNYKFGLRAQMIFNHYAALIRLVSQPFLEDLAQGKHLVLATLAGKTGGSYEITLGKTDKFDREGELILQLRDSAQRRAVFSFVFALNVYGDCTGVEIGCIQGPKDEDAREQIKRATKELYGIRPRNLLADALYELSATWNLAEHFGVSNRNRVYNGDQTHADYDAFWLELGGTLGKNGMFRLPTKLHHHQLSEVTSHHRSEYKQRMRLRESLGKQIITSARAFGTSLQ